MAGYGHNPQGNRADELRLLIGDTDNEDLVLDDGAIRYVLAKNPDNLTAAAIAALDLIIAKLTPLVNESAGGVSIAFGDRRRAYIELRASFTERLALLDAMPYAGGISKSDRAAIAGDTDRVPLQFGADSFKNPGTCRPGRGGCYEGDDDLLG